nr:EOG090X0BKO [Triops cancriformis]
MNILLVTQVTGYVIAFILSLCITVPVSLHQDDFRGHCLLFSSGTWREDGQFVVNWASQAYCNYAIFVGVILLVTSLVQIYRLSLFLYKGVDSSFLSAFVDAIGSTVLCLMALAAALIITFGFEQWCRNIMQRFEQCDYAAENPIDKDDNINTSGFYVQMGTAQFAAWASWACWVGLVVCAFLKICRYHQLENMRVSMARERKRLLNDGLPERESRNINTVRRDIDSREEQAIPDVRNLGDS